MALKALMLKKKIELKRKERDALTEKRQALQAREDELAAAIEEVASEEEQAVIEESVTALTEEKEQLEKSADALEKIIADLEAELEDTEAAQDTEPDAPAQTEERSAKPMNTMETMRAGLAGLVTRDDVKSWLTETRSAMREKRALTNVGVTIPEVLLDLLKQKIEGYSKLYKHVTVRQISGTGRQPIMGTVPEGIWTDCCAVLNELTLAFYDVELDCFKVGGFFAVCNANLEDSDIALAAELLDATGQAIGLALDKAILYGRNAAGTQRMPQGIVSRLVQTAEPSGYSATARPWADLHTANVITIASTVTGADLIAAIVTASGAMSTKYARNAPVWAMNRKTYVALMATLVNINAAGAVVTGLENAMPVLGGPIETLDFIPDNVIIGGYFEDYILGERAGRAFATSEHVRFINDQTVLKGTARYDGAPSIAEAFIAIGINGATPDATMTFAADTAN